MSRSEFFKKMAVVGALVFHKHSCYLMQCKTSRKKEKMLVCLVKVLLPELGSST